MVYFRSSHRIARRRYTITMLAKCLACNIAQKYQKPKNLNDDLFSPPITVSSCSSNSKINHPGNRVRAIFLSGWVELYDVSHMVLSHSLSHKIRLRYKTSYNSWNYKDVRFSDSDCSYKNIRLLSRAKCRVNLGIESNLISKKWYTLYVILPKSTKNSIILATT